MDGRRTDATQGGASARSAGGTVLAVAPPRASARRRLRGLLARAQPTEAVPPASPPTGVELSPLHQAVVSARRAELAPGAVLGGRYRIEGVIGRGGMSVVHAAHDPLLLRDVAIKVMDATRGVDGAGHPVETEARLAAALCHPGLMTVLDAGTHQLAGGASLFYLVMERARRGDLRTLLQDHPLPWAVTARLGTELALALAHLHDAGYLHRDVKPANVLITGVDADGRIRARLTDFGTSSHPARSSDTTAVGTAAYLSPEQVGGRPATARSDVYALGLLLIECRTGAVEFPGPLQVSMTAHVRRDPLLPGGLPPAAAEALRAMTDRVPERRPSAAEAADLLRNARDAPRSVGRHAAHTASGGDAMSAGPVAGPTALPPAAAAADGGLTAIRAVERGRIMTTTTTAQDLATGPTPSEERPHRVLLATDGGLGSTAAIRWLAARATTSPIAVELAEVLDPDDKPGAQEPGMSSGDRGADADTATEHARDMLLQLAPHVRVRRVVLHGDPVPELLKRAADVDLLVVGSNRAVRVLPHLTPSFATRLAGASRIPIVVVPTGWEHVPGPVVVGVEGDGSDDAAIEFAAQEAERTGRQLVVVRAWGLFAELVADGHDMRARAGEAGSEALLTQVLEQVRAAHPQLDPVPMLHHGTPIEMLVNLGRGASLVVVGTHRRADADRLLLRSVSKRILERPVCAIALVPPA